MNQERLGRLIRFMEERGIDQVLLSNDLDLFFYTGAYEPAMERLRVLLVDRQATCRYYANELFALDGKVICHKDGQELSALRDLASHLKPGGVVAVDGAWPSRFLLELLPLAPDCRFCPARELLSLPMCRKDKGELSLLRRASQINDLVVDELILSITSRSTELGLSQSIHALYDKHGSDGHSGGALVAFGANCASPHPQSRSVCPQPGDSILIDAGAPYQRYESDMTRTVFFRDVDRKLEQIYHVVLEANMAGIDAVRPGRRAQEVDQICRSVIEKSGYGPYFTHRTGHGIGLHLHEEPYISVASQTILEEGMVFSIEPGIYIPQLGGVRIEDLVAVTSSGVEVLNHLSKDLRVLE